MQCCEKVFPLKCLIYLPIGKLTHSFLQTGFYYIGGFKAIKAISQI